MSIIFRLGLKMVFGRKRQRFAGKFLNFHIFILIFVKCFYRKKNNVQFFYVTVLKKEELLSKCYGSILDYLNMWDVIVI